MKIRNSSMISSFICLVITSYALCEVPGSTQSKPNGLLTLSYSNDYKAALAAWSTTDAIDELEKLWSASLLIDRMNSLTEPGLQPLVKFIREDVNWSSDNAALVMSRLASLPGQAQSERFQYIGFSLLASEFPHGQLVDLLGENGKELIATSNPNRSAILVEQAAAGFVTADKSVPEWLIDLAFSLAEEGGRSAYPYAMYGPPNSAWIKSVVSFSNSDDASEIELKLLARRRGKELRQQRDEFQRLIINRNAFKTLVVE